MILPHLKSSSRILQVKLLLEYIFRKSSTYRQGKCTNQKINVSYYTSFPAIRDVALVRGVFHSSFGLVKIHPHTHAIFSRIAGKLV